MAKPLNRKRSKLVVDLIDNRRLSYSQVARVVGLKAKSTVFEIYELEKERSAKEEKAKKKLSTP